MMISRMISLCMFIREAESGIWMLIPYTKINAYKKYQFVNTYKMTPVGESLTGVILFVYYFMKTSHI